MLRLAVIGFGGRAAGLVRTIRDLEPQVQLVAVSDPDASGVRQRLKEIGHPDDATRFCTSVDDLLDGADAYDGVLIGTRCFQHAQMACKVAPTGVPLYLEKPVAITPGERDQLAHAFAGREDSVIVSFPLRATPLYTAALGIVRSGRLGPINQVQANNNVPYGGCYFAGWYRNYDQVGGLWLQKATHDFDYLTHMLDARPLMIAATSTQLVYGGQMPHELHCAACDQVDTCSESYKAQRLRGDDGGMSMDDRDLATDGLGRNHRCPFSSEIRNQDAGSAIIMYEGGAHVCYSQNFISRRGAGKRGAIVTGHFATLEFDWYRESIRVFDHHDDRVDDITVKTSAGHSGGDAVLCRNFIGMMQGKEKPLADLRDGLQSVTMCMAARQSAYSHTFQAIVPPWMSPDTVPTPHPATEFPVA